MGVGTTSSLRAATAPRLPDRYQVRRHVASGGMASVWCAEDRVLGRSVAVKVLADRFAHDEFAVRRFKREARTAARVSGHPHVVTIFDVGDIAPDEEEPQQDQRPAQRAFMVMEYLPGGTVADAIRVGAVRRHEALRWLEQAASALDHAHKRGIVHRDIKPANFLLDNDRVLHVADFGIARLQSEDTITSSGELFGTAAYLSPEQALGGEATGASDRYSLALVAFELLAGRRPFQASHFAAQARQHVEDEVPRASEIEPSLPPAVDAVLSRGMAKHPHERYETAGGFVTALEQALEEPVTARTVPVTVRTVPLTRRSAGAGAAGAPRSAGAAAGAGAAAAGAGAAAAGAAALSGRLPAQGAKAGNARPLAPGEGPGHGPGNGRRPAEGAGPANGRRPAEGAGPANGGGSATSQRPADGQGPGNANRPGNADRAGIAHTPGAASSSAKPGWSPVQLGSSSRRRSGRAAALAALALVLIGVAALALLGHSSSKPSARIASQSATQHKQSKGSRASASHRRRRTGTRSSSSTPATAGTASSAAPASTTASAPSTTAASPPASASASAEALQAQGHQELAAGSYSQAISTLRQALHAADPSSLTYAYALYDLGRALTLGGDPQAAIPILEQRLRIPNQTAVVQQALDEARRAAGQSGAGATSSSAPPAPAAPAQGSAKPKDSHGQGSGSSESGGAAVPPGQSKHGD